MAPVSNARLRFLFEALGANKIVKDMKMIKAGLKDVADVAGKLKLGPKGLGKLQDLAVGVQANAQKLKAMDQAAKVAASSVKMTRTELARLVKTGKTMKGLGIDQMIPKKTKPMIQGIGSVLDGLQTKINTNRNKMKAFRMELLSFLFFGMMMQRVFLGISRAATASFTKIVESSNMQGTAIQRLGAHWEFLKFTIGSAINRTLEQLMPMITNLIMKISEWVQKNPKLVTTLLAIGAALGTMMVVGSQFKLLFGGLFKSLSTIFAPGSKGILASVLRFAGINGLGALGVTLLWIIGIAAALWLAWKTNIGGMQKIFKNMFGGILSTAKSQFKDLVSFFSNIWGFITSILTGDWDKAWDHIVDALLAAVRFIVKGFVGLINVFSNLGAWIGNVLIDALFKIIINGLIFLGAKIVDLLGSVFGFDFGLADKTKGFRNKVNDFADSLHFDTGVKSSTVESLNKKIDMTIRVDRVSNDTEEKKAIANDVAGMLREEVRDFT